MKSAFRYGIGVWLLVSTLWTSPLQAQTITGAWQGVETDPREKGNNWPAVLRLQKTKSPDLFGVLYQEVGGLPGTSVTFQMQGKQTGNELRLEHKRKLTETGMSPNSVWCDGAITLTYDAKLEKLTGRATYRPVSDCDYGTFTFYRIKLKSAGTVKAGILSTHRVSGRDVRWFADADLKQPVAAGNSYPTKLSKTTTFYLTQGYYPSTESPVVPITIQVTGKAPKVPVAVRPAPNTKPKPAALPTPAPALRDTVRQAPVLMVAPTPVVLPTVLFKLGTAELLPEGVPALNRLAAELKARPSLNIQVAGYTDKLGEPDKNQTLSEQRAEAVKAFLVKENIAPERIRTIGYGDSRPLYPSPDARNRRVEVAEKN